MGQGVGICIRSWCRVWGSRLDYRGMVWGSGLDHGTGCGDLH